MPQPQTKTEENNYVLFNDVNNAGVVTLNRPKSLNALNFSMVNQLLPKLKEWERTKTCVLIKSAGGKAFCSGGDIISLHSIENNKGEFPFAYVEYNVNYLIGRYRIPYVALINGFAMGGGLGVSVHGRYRVATENTVVAMPETKIGLLPDVGGTYFLPRLKHHIGFYMGLTGQRFKGKDAVLIGLATHFVPSSRLPQLETDLTQCSNEAQIKRCLDSFSVQPGEFSLAAQIKHIDHCFSAGTMEEVLQRLSEVNNEWSSETLKTLAHMCPTMLKVTLLALHRGRQQDLAQCLQMEYRVTNRCPGSHNLREGVRALLIDRDNKPRWQPATLAEVTDDEVESYFKRLPEHMELKFSDSKL